MYDQSVFDREFSVSRLAYEKVKAIVHFAKDSYFQLLRYSPKNYNAPYSVLCDVGCYSDRHSFSDITFRECFIYIDDPLFVMLTPVIPIPELYSKTEVTAENYDKIPATDEPVIIILGLVNPRTRTIERPFTDYSNGWLVRGTIALAAGNFLNGRLLSLLSQINAATTIVPATISFHGGQWVTNLTPWANHPLKKGDDTAWVDATGREDADVFEYVWNNEDKYEYHNRGIFGAEETTRLHFLNSRFSLPLNRVLYGSHSFFLSQ